MSGTTETKGKTAVVETPPTFSEIMNKAGASAIRGGTAGAVAMGANVACLMWMRTTVSQKLRDTLYKAILNRLQEYSSLTLVIFYLFFFSSISSLYLLSLYVSRHFLS
jgi:hypothetical protein